ncbi:uncharacterized protein KGF55_000215 [Candida pseudojiufengensis]|uniref:uncharacterized protein n=1 Tax=Candida pseudojiufengensis TaxID=497109 RepID=UPI0022242BC6|nr:uncharacterized protein KGF55_000215 [Candida pseudojiufengensis]KAI5966806.1 hypothetical protein KGF55_000215 [Candida pseudojiufengensis]
MSNPQQQFDNYSITKNESNDHHLDHTEKSSFAKTQTTSSNDDSITKQVNGENVDNYNYRKSLNTTTKSIGIRRVELLNSQYNKPFLKIVFFTTIFFCAYSYGLESTIRGNLQYYATSSFQQHSLFTTVGVMQSVISCVAQPFYARLSDKYGRLELFLFALVFYSIGLIIQSQAYDINRFAGGAVVYQIGFTGVMVLFQIILSDASTLNYRLCAVFIPALPFIINTWVSGDVQASVNAKYSWNWGIGMWAFIFPLSCLPFIACFIHMIYKARKTEEWKQLNLEVKKLNPHSKLSWTFWKNFFVDMFWDLDVIGLLCIVIVLGFILVPFTIAGGVTSTWARASTIVPLVIGVVFIPIFVLWEAKFAKSPILPFVLIKDRGVWAALLIAIFINWIWYMPNDFMYTVLIVGMNASVKAATRITSLYSFVSVIVGPLLGLVVSRVRRLKGFIIFGCICWAVSLGILFHFRGSNDGIESQKYLNGVIGGLCLMGFGAGFFTYTTQVSITTVTNHEYMSIVISIYLASYWIGSCLGTSISGAIWTNKMHGVILDKMQEMNISNSTGLAAEAYNSPFTFILENTWGTPARQAVVLSYAEVQRYLCIAGLVLCFPLIVFSLLLRDHRLDSVQSLEQDHDHEKQGIVRDGVVVVNNYDDDPIFKFFKNSYKKVFGRSESSKTQ